MENEDNDTCISEPVTPRPMTLVVEQAVVEMELLTNGS